MEKSGPKDLATSVIFKKASKSKQSPNGFAQSGHPAGATSLVVQLQ
jgi:hypothetical protein